MGFYEHQLNAHDGDVSKIVVRLLLAEGKRQGMKFLCGEGGPQANVMVWRRMSDVKCWSGGAETRIIYGWLNG